MLRFKEFARVEYLNNSLEYIETFCICYSFCSYNLQLDREYCSDVLRMLNGMDDNTAIGLWTSDYILK